MYCHSISDNNEKLPSQAHVYQTDTGKCAAFLVNQDSVHDSTIHFRNATYQLPHNSISILSNCKNVAFNTAKVSAQYGTRSAKAVEYFNQASRWKATMEKIPTSSSSTWVENELIDQMAATKDLTDYLWYITRYNNTSGNENRTIHVNSLAHVIHAFVNNEYVGTVHGSHGSRGAVVLSKTIPLGNGQNEISLLSVMVGLPDSGAYLERRVAGLRRVGISNSDSHFEDLSSNRWTYQVGLSGEKSNVFTEQGTKTTDWETVESFPSQPLVWYMARFEAPAGNDPLALNLISMGKGEAWINGESIGRYWVSFKTPKGVPSQSLYHVPRSFIKPSGNLLVLFEEMGGNPSAITLDTISVTGVCGRVAESHPKSMASLNKDPSVKLHCPEGRAVSSIEFASYGSPVGNCDSHSIGSCHSAASRTVVEKACLGRRRCSVPVSSGIFGDDPCPSTSKSLLIAAKCQ